MPRRGWVFATVPFSDSDAVRKWVAMLGPVEYLTVQFTSEESFASAAAELADLVDRGTIHIIDLVFVHKNGDGTVTVAELDELDQVSRAFESVPGEYGGLISDEDIADAAQLLPPGTGEALIVWENLWAKPLLVALGGAGGTIVQDLHIPAAAAAAAYDSLPPPT